MAEQATKAETNGRLTQEDVLARLQEQVTVGYRPSIPIEGMFNGTGLPQMSLRQDMEVMLTHPAVRQSLTYFAGGISGADFWGGVNPDSPEDSQEAEQGLPICPENPKIGRFIKEQCERFWDRGVPGLQEGYKYGWIGSEQLYDDSDGVLKWDNLFTFRPTDTFLLTQDFKPVGIRVKNVQASGPIDLWMAGENVPAKGLWYAHQPRYGAFYGQSQLLAAWRPWRRLAWKDGLESVIDMALYRLGVGWLIGRYPNDDLQGPSPGAPSTTLDSQGNPRRFSRDIMRQILEQAKAGAAVGLPSVRDTAGQYKWDINIPNSTLAGIEGLLSAAKALSDQITGGIGVPPELIQAADTGSGYSGRRIPLEAFLANQQQIADAMLRLFVDQVLRPLVLYNFGKVKFNVQVKSLIKTRTKQSQQSQSNGNPDPNRSEAARKAWETRRQHESSQAMFSHHPLVTDRVREIARRIVRSA